jgi:hypothetical protein
MFIVNISGPSRRRPIMMLTLVAYSKEQKIIELSFRGGSKRICVQEHIKKCNSENGRQQKVCLLASRSQKGNSNIFQTVILARFCLMYVCINPNHMYNKQKYLFMSTIFA